MPTKDTEYSLILKKSQLEATLSNYYLIATKSKKEHRRDRVHVGDIQLTPQTNSVTFHVRSNGDANLFELNLITLERIN